MTNLPRREFKRNW